MTNDLRIGDEVEITRYRTYDHDYEGLRGKLAEIDDDSVPYLVDTAESGRVWAERVRKIADEIPGSRVALVDKARSLLVDTDHTAADIIRLAEFLAAE